MKSTMAERDSKVMANPSLPDVNQSRQRERTHGFRRCLRRGFTIWLKTPTAARSSRASFSPVKKLAALSLVFVMLTMCVPPALARTGINGFGGTSIFGGLTLPGMLWNLGLGQGAGTPTVERFRPQTHAPRRVSALAERAARVAQLLVNAPNEMTLQAQQRINFVALPLDSNGVTVHGVDARWESSDRLVILVTTDGQAFARSPGKARLTVKAGYKQAQIVVTVLEGASSESSTKSEAKLAHSARLKNAASAQQEPPQLPIEEVDSLYEPRNAVGSPPNRTTVGASTPPAANRRGGELPGSDNFNFSVPVTGLPGRGLDVRLNLYYNSRLWNKSVSSGGATRLTYDVDKGWPAPGFTLGYGRIETHSASKYTLTDPNGTRHELRRLQPGYNTFETVDGTYIRYYGDQYSGMLIYADGTRVEYSWSGATLKLLYPYKVTDPSGNYILFNYDYTTTGQPPRLLSIKDTLSRFVRFHYEGNTDKLIAVTEPGYQEIQDRQTIRFYYEEMPINAAGSFHSSVTVTAPATARVIRYIYFPGTKSGYRYDYSPYGMIRQIIQLRDMTASTTSLTETGMVTSEGQGAATTTYNYPEGRVFLMDAPTYTRRTDDWAGRTAGMNGTTEPPYFTFSNNFNEGVLTSTITAPDGTVTETTGAGLVDVTEIKKPLLGSTFQTYAKTRIQWETVGFGNTNRRLKQVQQTNEAGQTKTTDYAYTTYNNISQITERDFNIDAATLGLPLRRTKMRYTSDASSPNSQEYINRWLLRLKTQVEVFSVAPNGSESKMSRVDYSYDETPLVSRPNGENDPNRIMMHDPRYDPYAPLVEECEVPELCPHCEPICTWVPQYDSSSARRGNLTSIRAYADAAAGTLGSHRTFTYDIAGNVVSEGTLSCCQQRTYVYDAAYQYAYPTSDTSGSGPQLTTGATYDYDTGLLRTSTDENTQTTTLHYYPESLRPYQVVRPDGSSTETIYFNDMLFADPDATHMHSAVMTISSMDTGRTVRNWQFFDGLGNVARAFGDNAGQGHVGAVAVAYDEMGRMLRQSNPYYAIYGGGSPINPTNKWTTYKYDPLGRVIQITLPDGDAAQNTNVRTAEYAGTVTTITDPAGKQRRQTADALGRIVRIDEPDGTGALNQATTYTYNALNNLIKITQGEQTRYFKYDSLSRLTHERQVEQDAPHQQADALTGNNWWSRKIAYNEFGLATDSWDARTIHTHLTYDGLNRLKQVTYAGETATTTPTVTYTYDEARQGYFNRGKLTTVMTAAVSGTQTDAPLTKQAYDYDRMGRITRQQQTVGTTTYALGYGYNLAGQLTSQTYPSGRTVNRTYDAASRLASLTDSAGQSFAANLSYAGHGALESVTWGNGAAQTMAYNDRLQISQIKLTAGGTERQRFDYSYGEINVDTAVLDTTRNTGQIAVIDGWIDGVKQWQQRYAYDKVGRLSTAKELNNDSNGSLSWRVDYTYDRFGNRYQAAGQGGVPVAWEDVDRTRNRYVSSASSLMIYDGAGNLTIDQKFRGLQYTYDANGRMRRSDGTMQYAIATYDGIGQRAQHYESGVVRQSVYDIFGQVVSDYEGGSWKRDYVYLGVSLLATIDGTGTRYVLTDHQGSTRAVMNGSKVTERHDYRPFGEEIGAYTGLRTVEQGYNAANPVRQQFAMNERDQSTGLDHTLWRKYEPFSGKWTSPDPYRESMKIRDPQSFNRYTYVENDPVNFVDPSGLEWVPIIQRSCVTTGTIEGADDPIGPQTVCTYRILFVWMNQPGGYQGPPPQEPRVRCGVNPVTNQPGFTPDPHGTPGNLRIEDHGGGDFGDPRPGRDHNGLDIAGTLNTSPVYANRAGVVTEAHYAGAVGGWVVQINHGGGVSTRYVHLQANSIPAGVTVGQRVEQGQQIGVVGNTGNARNLPAAEAHVHFGVFVNGHAVDPAHYLNNPCPQ